MRIAVEASGVHLIDTVIRRGEGGGPFPLPDLPMTPGREVAGTVDALGPGVGPEWLGRRVVAHLGWASGGYAERAVAAVTALHEVPDTMPAGAAVAMIGTGRTAMMVLDSARLTGDDVVLVTAAAGGLGTLFVQAAHNLGATVVGAAGGPEKTGRVAEAGAIAVDYLEDGWPQRVQAALRERQVSVVLDGVGGAAGRAAFELLGPSGRHVLFGWSSGEPTRFSAQDLVGKGLTVTALGRPRDLRSLETRALADAAAGRWVPLVQRFPLTEAARAHRALESRKTAGKGRPVASPPTRVGLACAGGAGRDTHYHNSGGRRGG